MPDLFIREKKKSPGKTAPKEIKIPMKILGHFEEKPNGVHFENQKAGEEIVLFLRRHLITNVPWVITLVFLIVALPLSVLILNLTGVSLSFIPGNYSLILILFYYLVLFAFALVSIMYWFYNITLITTLGVVDIDYSDILYHDVAFTNLNLVEDVNYTKTGFFRSFFNFGDVFIQTAGGKENLEALAVPHPAKAAHIVADSIGRTYHSG